MTKKKFSHQPDDYQCPFCKMIRGEEDEINTKDQIVYEDAETLAYVSPKWWVNNPGNVLVLPKQHTENIYSISENEIAAVYKTAKKIAVAIRETYDCDGTSTRQHNEPDGNQDVWHFHVHVFARFKGDNLYQNHDNKRWVTHEERQIYAQKLQKYFADKSKK